VVDASPLQLPAKVERKGGFSERCRGLQELRGRFVGNDGGFGGRGFYVIHVYREVYRRGAPQLRDLAWDGMWLLLG